jgi:hypothetical protein
VEKEKQKEKLALVKAKQDEALKERKLAEARLR